MNVINQCANDMMMSQERASALLKLLDTLLLEARREFSDLADVQQRLSDAFSLSQWLREEVSLELHAAEQIELSEALQVMLNRYPWSDGDCQALNALIDQLSSAASLPVSGQCCRGKAEFRSRTVRPLESIASSIIGHSG